MEQKRQLTEQEEKSIKEYAETSPAIKHRVPVFAFGYRSGLEDMAERSVPLSEFIKLREALWEAVKDIHQLIRVAKHNAAHPDTIAVNQVHQRGIAQSESVITSARAALQSTEHLMPKS